MSDLRACPNPKCGSGDVRCIGDDGGAAVECSKCHSSVTMESRETATRVWNGDAEPRGLMHYGVFTSDRGELCGYTATTNRGYDIDPLGVFKTERQAAQFKHYLETVARMSCTTSDWQNWYTIKPVRLEVDNG